MKALNKLLQVINPYQAAVKAGLNAGKGVEIVGRSNFGSEPYLITLEDYVRVSFGVTFITHDGGTWVFRDLPKYQKVFKYGRIHVGERTFIGCKSIIMPGVTIGKRCVIGAGSLVTKDVSDGMVACGVPARMVMTVEEYAEKCLDRMKPYDEEDYFRDKRAFLEKWL